MASETSIPVIAATSGVTDDRTSRSELIALTGKTAAFFKALWGTHGDPTGKLGICSRNQGFSSTWFDITEEGIQAAANRAIELGEDVYFHCASHEPSKTTGRGCNDSASKIAFLWADIDLAESNKGNGKNYPPREFALRALHNLQVPPSCIVGSGNGLHAYWFFTEPVSAQEHTRMPAAFLAYLRQQFVDKDTGEVYDIDTTGDLARLMRVPYTRNSGAERTVSVIVRDDRMRYRVEDLARLCPATRSLPVDTTAHAGIVIELDPEAEPPRAKLDVLMEDRRFADTWEHRRRDLRDQSPSSYDMSLASQAVRAGWTDQEITDLLIAHRRKHGGDSKLRLDYYQRTLKNARGGMEEQADEVDAIVDELNQRHAVVHAGQTFILTEMYEPVFNRNNIVLESKQSLHDWYEPWKFDGKPVSKHWFSHPRRRQYEGLVFSPDGDVPGYFNMFRGFPITPCEGYCSRYLALIWDVICNRNLEHYDYVIGWFAHLFQRPGELPGTALVLRGPQGTGKGTMMKYAGKLVGQHFLELVQMSQVIGRFNAHLKDALLVHANEAIWGGDKASEGAIKAMVTDETSAVEFKGKDIITVKNYKRLVLASNNDWVVPRDMDDRRFFVLDVSDVHKEDQAYFSAIHDEMSAGGLEALMHDLLHIDLDGFNPRVMPATGGAGFDMKLRSMDSVMQWLFEILDEGVLPPPVSTTLQPVDSTWPTEYPKVALHDLYIERCRRQNQRHPDSAPLLGRKLNGILPTLSEIRKSYPGRPRYYRLPSLEECRRNFEAACKEGPNIWSEEDTA